MDTSEAISATAVASLAERRLDWRHKAIPAAANGITHADFLAAKPTLAALQTPLLTLDAQALQGNADHLAKWCADKGVLLAPHGKTTMSPQLWAEQLNRGAWGITLANFAQLRVARGFGVRNLQLANSLTDPHAIQWVAEQDSAILSWVDSVDTVALIERTLAGTDSVLDVLVELGAHGGRTGARGVDAALEVARAVDAAEHLRLVGVAGYEGSLAHTADDAGLAAVRGYLAKMRLLHEELLAAGLYGSGSVIITAGGSAYFDDVVTVLSPCISTTAEAAPTVSHSLKVDLMIRSGAYIIHDDGFYRGISPFSRAGNQPFSPGMYGWARVVSQPEPGLALLDAGKRDLPFDEGLPEPQFIGSTLGGAMEPLVGAEITSVNDQHSFLTFNPDTTTVRPGDVVRLGLSHPCTAFDKWTVIPVLADSTPGGDQTVVDLIHTFF
ncbi:alanine racemase [Paenarthrobacter nicotinovorans]|uniref:alanine racemase n=1 Tax=Paenarthrobacter nicotinovorans TaxID=29320 RepID=UPI001664C655|nr:alanine racemase [Paenarthrobacter nicotinovorans]MBP2394689.1 D-serine deaminase-like pyridoxal phosphate-dependent protein [Paenarthrobacter nicotinovorans]UKE99137.1 alanine racemase [Paenarthrobacter nicotinovorans]UKF03917.1 alanine racemase [Paenarthrobacter nicotinovorans]GGV42429.1 alanine racemase [Paenarthrobacter nicotinovorans]